MRRAISVILAAVLVTMPIKMVLAQAGQQESQVTAPDIPSVVPPRTDQTPFRIGVPVVEPNSDAALLFTAGMRDHTLARNALPLSPPYRQIPTAGKVVLVVLAIFFTAVLVFSIYCITEGCWK